MSVTFLPLQQKLSPSFGKNKTPQKPYSGYLKTLQLFVAKHCPVKYPGKTYENRTMDIIDPQTGNVIGSLTQRGDLFCAETNNDSDIPNPGPDCYFQDGRLVQAYVPQLESGQQANGYHLPSPEVDKAVTKQLSQLVWDLFHGHYRINTLDG